MPTRRSGSGWETHPDVHEDSVGPPECPGGIRRTTWSFGRGRESLPEVREAYPDVRKGRKTHPEVLEGS